MSPKPAYEELQKLVKGKWWTTTRVRTGNDGTAAVRGFLGEYRLTVRAGSGKPVTAQATLRREQANRWTVKLD